MLICITSLQPGQVCDWPQAWVYRYAVGAQVSALDLCGNGRFTLLTGLGGEEWASAAGKVATDQGIDLVVHIIGPRKTYVDHSGDWARVAEIRDDGCLVVRPDHHVAWRSVTKSSPPDTELMRVFRLLLAR